MYTAVLAVNMKVCFVLDGVWYYEWMVLSKILLFLGVHIHFATFTLQFFAVQDIFNSYRECRVIESIFIWLIAPIFQLGLMYLYFYNHTWPLILIFLIIDAIIAGIVLIIVVSVKVYDNYQFRK